MPFYDLECQGTPSCGEVRDAFMSIRETDSPTCPNCKASAKILIRGQAVNVFKEGWWDSLDPRGPIYIKSKKHLREECRKRGLTSHYTVDGVR